MACSHYGLNGGISAHCARDVTLKRSRDQSKVCWITYTCMTELVHKIIDQPSYTEIN